MINIYENTWYYTNVVLENTGMYNYSIWMYDYYSNINITTSIINVISTSEIVFTIVIFFGLIIGMLIFYLKLKIYLIILTIFLFSIIFSIMALNIYLLPFSPYLQIFFLMFQAVIFLFTTLELNEKRGIKK